MLHQDFTKMDRLIGKTTALAIFFLLVMYAVTLTMGLLSLESKLEPISDPFFSIMEILIIVIAPLMVVLMAVVHAYAAPNVKTLSLTALIFMSILACITCSVHFIILTVSRQAESIVALPWISLFFSFKWPSVIYALDILAWDLFFSLSMFFAAPVFKGDRLKDSVRILMIVSGVLSLAGLIGPIVGSMQIRNIGIVGYVGVFSIVCLLLAKVFSRTELYEESIAKNEK
ncbi:MAG: hypothetical protein MJA84_16715 [Firmicutes bacterium]|nr:hypothetical protein [Bacillota bacterium]